MFFLFFVAMSISFEVIKRLKKKNNFAAKLIIAIFNIDTWNFKTKQDNNYLATEKSFLIWWLFWNKPFSGFLHNLESSNFLRRWEILHQKIFFSNTFHHKLFLLFLCVFFWWRKLSWNWGKFCRKWANNRRFLCLILH